MTGHCRLPLDSEAAGSTESNASSDLQRLRLALEASQKQAAMVVRDWKRSYEEAQRRTTELERSYYDTLVRLLRVSQFRSVETSEHMTRVGMYSAVVARLLGLGEDFASLISAAAPLHDLGKVGIPDSILLFNGPLNSSQVEVMRKHPRVGFELLAGSHSPVLSMAAEIALTHHERFDGTGYPQALHGEAIPITGRITMLADLYDALRSQRIYKNAMTHREACEIILHGDRRSRPEHLDPGLLELFRQRHRMFESIFDALEVPTNERNRE